MADEIKKGPFAVLSPLRHDGKHYQPVEGKVVKVQLTDEEAEALKELGVVGDVPVSKKQEAPAS